MCVSTCCTSRSDLLENVRPLASPRLALRTLNPSESRCLAHLPSSTRCRSWSSASAPLPSLESAPQTKPPTTNRPSSPPASTSFWISEWSTNHLPLLPALEERSLLWPPTSPESRPLTPLSLSSPSEGTSLSIPDASPNLPFLHLLTA